MIMASTPSDSPASPVENSNRSPTTTCHAAIDDMGIVESLHQVVFHWIIDDLFRRFSAKEAVFERRFRSSLTSMADPPVLGIEIGGTKLQLGIGFGHGTLLALKRLEVDPERGAAGILEQIKTAFRPLLIDVAGLGEDIKAVGVGFGGPVDSDPWPRPKILSDRGLGRFPADGLDPRALQSSLHRRLENDADVAGLAECRFGAGSGHSPLLYITVGSGIGGAPDH